MARKLKPCGTYAAYARHLRNGERPCDPCTLANRERYDSAPTGFNAYERQMAAALEENPPVIVWELDPTRMIRVPVYINDPHAEGARTHRNDELDDEFEVFLDAEPAPECTDENLLSAARTEI